MKTLIVDDNENSRMILKSILGSKKHVVTEVTNGRDALKMARKSPPDIIISDILMPVMDGFQLCREWKKDENLKQIPFVFYTATYTDKNDEAFAYNIGADRFIVKPVEPDKFIKIIQEVIEEAEKGKIKHGRPAGIDEKEGYKLYSKRLVQKLEKKMLDLEREVATRKQAEKQLRISLKEKEVLLKEIHHRVKNNFQVISSLLDMRIMRTDNKQVINRYEDIRSKIYTMSLVHAQLYQSEQYDQINMGTHIQKLVDYLAHIYTKKNVKITPIIDHADISLSLTHAIPCSLVLTELISNAFKHAFKEGQRGTIAISMQRSGKDTIIIIVKDDGVGISDTFDIHTTNSLGLKLVRNVVQKQLNGKITIKKNQGTECIITIRVTS